MHLYTADNFYEADFIKKDLAGQGIVCMLTNVNFSSLMPHMNGMLGSGIQILVDKEDYDRAIAILDRRNNVEVRVCPYCNSNNISYGLGTKHRFKKLIALGIALVIASPVQHIKQTYYCRDCKSEFGK